MPVYEYRCTQCIHTFERYQSVGEPAPVCPACGGPTRKVYNSVGLIFKGSGFHATDYRRPASGDGEQPKTDAAKTPAPASSTSDSSSPAS